MDTAVFLDRDNTLIANDGDLGDPAAVTLLDGVASGLVTLRKAGYRLVVVTNQGGVARGLMSEEDVDRVHERLARLVDDAGRQPQLIDRFYYCPFHPEGADPAYRRDHPWRKPRPGMLLQAARDLNLDLSRSWLVGDQGRDIEAGRSAGCRTVLLETPRTKADDIEPTAVVKSFPDAVRTILAKPPAASRPGVPATRRPPATRGDDPVDELRSLRRSIGELTEQLQLEHTRRREFSGLRIGALMVQFMAILLVVLGVLQTTTPPVFFMWVAGAVVAQLLTIAILLMDVRA